MLQFIFLLDNRRLYFDLKDFSLIFLGCYEKIILKYIGARDFLDKSGSNTRNFYQRLVIMFTAQSSSIHFYIIKYKMLY